MKDFPPSVLHRGSYVEPERPPPQPGIRSPFVENLFRLDATDTRTRLVAVKAAVRARIAAISSPTVRAALQIEADRIDLRLLHAAQDAVELLAEALAVSHGESRLPSAHPERTYRR